ncbi:hypothetical protein C8F01DRAFT_1228192 [Mycena amicta]|nr:hypothetical protein C8F01DRAFT_1228192 [Mycena amicta]
MRLSLPFTLLVSAAVASALAIPPTKRAVNCASTDKDGTGLTGSSATSDEAGNALDVCSYTSAGACTYFTDGSFSSGSSTCPKGVAQNAAASSSDQQQSTSQQQQAGSISSAVNCPATDKGGSSLTSSSPSKDEAGNALVNCDYTSAGSCTYFTDGSFSSGSSQCPKGEQQTGGSGSGGQAVTTTSPPPAQTTTTQAPPPPPPPPTTTSSTQVVVTTAAPPPPPPATTTSTTPPVVTSTTDTPPIDTPAPPPPTSVQPTSTQIDFTTVIVPAPTDTAVANSGNAAPQGGLSGGAMRRAPSAGVGLLLGMLVGVGLWGMHMEGGYVHWRWRFSYGLGAGLGLGLDLDWSWTGLLPV